MSRRLIPVLWIAVGVGLILVILALSQSTTTAPVSHRVPGDGRMQPFYGVQPGQDSTQRSPAEARTRATDK